MTNNFVISSPEWNEGKHFKENYLASGFLPEHSDLAFGRNKKNLTNVNR